jgi:hypothetical protein
MDPINKSMIEIQELEKEDFTPNTARKTMEKMSEKKKELQRISISLQNIMNIMKEENQKSWGNQ